jgi:hypothetical protein
MRGWRAFALRLTFIPATSTEPGVTSCVNFHISLSIASCQQRSRLSPLLMAAGGRVTGRREPFAKHFSAFHEFDVPLLPIRQTRQEPRVLRVVPLMIIVCPEPASVTFATLPKRTSSLAAGICLTDATRRTKAAAMTSGAFWRKHVNSERRDEQSRCVKKRGRQHQQRRPYPFHGWCSSCPAAKSLCPESTECVSIENASHIASSG